MEMFSVLAELEALEEAPAPTGPVVRTLQVLVPPGEAFDLEATFRCGQIFRWRRHLDAWYGPFRSGSLRVRPLEGGLEVAVLGASAAELAPREVWRFLGLDQSLCEIEAGLADDHWVAYAVAAVPGLRILRQDPWECLAGYVCSQWNNIPKIELSLDRIAHRWGVVHQWPEGVTVASFPPPERLAALEAEDLRESALGYRCRFLVETARRVAGGAVDLQALRAASYEEALEALLDLPGVGRKVADCILLFALDKPEAFPVDVWVRRVMHERYGRALRRLLPDLPERLEKPLTAREQAAIVGFARRRWGRRAGYAQQYLFHARRLGLLGAVS
jgi:N-glycosylase/DNA lyase